MANPNGLNPQWYSFGTYDKTAGPHTIKGYTKFDSRPTGGATYDYNVQGRMETGKTSGTAWGLDFETHVVATTGTVAVRSVQGVAVVDTGKTVTGGGLTGVYGQARADGTFNAASAFMTGVYGLIEDSAAVTADHVASIWADSHMAHAVTGNHELIYMSNNGTTKMDQMMYAYGDADAFLHIYQGAGATLPTYVTDTATTSGDSKKIAIKINGSTFYINCYAG